MSVYVDAMRVPYGRLVLCHMVADSHDELLAMAQTIGLSPRWIQHPFTAREHFDICLSKRRAALAAGAQEVTTRELLQLLRRKVSPCF